MATTETTAITTTPAPDRRSVVVDRLTKQRQWYDKHAQRSRRLYVSIKVTQIVLAAMVPVLSGADAAASLVGSLGASIVALEGVQQLFQFHRNWVQYRASAGALEHEQYLHSVLAGDYARATDPDGLLATRLERVLQGESSQWLAQQRQADQEID
jgi:hypothetical protein